MLKAWEGEAEKQGREHAVTKQAALRGQPHFLPPEEHIQAIYEYFTP